MLEIKNVSKVYLTGDFKQNALNDVSIKFRRSEFVSILGPSGSGKTTLLNIIGGLDKYTTGDLLIDNISTKKYKDIDWDTYRNHRIGFVFQNYNLIQHQTILANVELSLRLVGVKPKERRERALKVLKEVGLERHINKKPNQLSGGQMQRVAIARALINNPDILLADEPTGALDSETSLQIMKILSDISKEKLVIMVTHNADLALEYSSRIVRLLDGNIIDDTNPYEASENTIEKTKKSKKTHMSFLSALSLSFNNLLTKKGRTIITAFAGSIGIIGIALILSLSNGVSEYIASIEEDTLSSYPITIEETMIDSSAFLTSFTASQDKNKHESLDKVYSNDVMVDMISLMTSKISTNNLEKFKTFLDEKKTTLDEYANEVKYSYSVGLQVYKEDADKVIPVNPSPVFDKLGMSNMAMTTDIWQQLMDNQTYLESQYDILAGSWPTAYNEIVLIVDRNNGLSDYALYSLGIKNQAELEEIMKTIMSGSKVETKETTYTYDELLKLKFRVVVNSELYKHENNLWVDGTTDQNFMLDKIKKGIELKVVGIIRPSSDAVDATKSIGYQSSLISHIAEVNNKSTIYTEQKKNFDLDVFTGMPFNKDMGTSLNNNLKKMGIIEGSRPSAINIYPKNFEAKEKIIDLIEEYNKDKKDNNLESEIINYTDYVGLLMKSVTSIVNTISYVLIAFVSISLVVSSIMIGIITYVSVLERTKEIGILRALGASKHDISRVFNAETFIVGIGAGLLGIGVTLLLLIPINSIIYNLVDIKSIASLPLIGAVALIIISTLLTIIGGLIPARIASKKDPVEALRTE